VLQYRPTPRNATVVAPSSVTSRDYNKMSRRTRPSTATSTCLLADHPTTNENAARADPERDGSTRSGRTTEFPRRTCGGVWRVVVTEEQRYGPRWLRDNDDDDSKKSVRYAAEPVGINALYVASSRANEAVWEETVANRERVLQHSVLVAGGLCNYWTRVVTTLQVGQYAVLPANMQWCTLRLGW